MNNGMVIGSVKKRSNSKILRSSACPVRAQAHLQTYDKRSDVWKLAAYSWMLRAWRLDTLARTWCCMAG
jgi:hypothetical protein